MSRKVFSFRSLGALCFAAFLLAAPAMPQEASTDDDANLCVTSSARARVICNDDGDAVMSVYNNCDFPVQARFCMKNTSGEWKCGVDYIAPGRRTDFNVCSVTGERFVDAKPDESPRRLRLPREQE